MQLAMPLESFPLNQTDQDDRCQVLKVISLEILTMKISRNVSNQQLLPFFHHDEV